MNMNDGLSKTACFSMIALSAVIYFLGFQLNDYLFSTIEFSHGVNWVFLPSGLRLILVLVLVEYGAIGISISSFLIGYEFYFEDNYFEIIVTSIISGFSPLLARYLSIRFFNVEPNLKNTTSRDLLKLSVLFSTISASLHQIWFVINHRTEHFLDATFVMSLGDWLGTALVLALASVLVAFLKKNVVKQVH